MKILSVIFAVFSALMPMITQKSGRTYESALRIKMLCAFMYLSTGVLATAAFRITDYSILILAALVFGVLGDFFLSYNKEKHFLAGVLFFAIGHIVYSCAFLFAGGIKAKDCIFLILISATVLYIPVFCIIKTKINLKKMELPFLIYSLILVFSFVCGIVRGVLLMKNGNYLQGICLIAGSILFITSDIVLGLGFGGIKLPHIFRHTVSYTYFPAQTLFAISICFQ